VLVATKAATMKRGWLHWALVAVTRSLVIIGTVSVGAFVTKATPAETLIMYAIALIYFSPSIKPFTYVEPSQRDPWGE
jgi:ABC-type proline/glycine betaine transport system permease subunit